jgi:hypothetical protein
MSMYYTGANLADLSRDRRAAAEHARLVRAARSTASPRTRRIRVHVPRISFRTSRGVSVHVAATPA